MKCKEILKFFMSDELEYVYSKNISPDDDMYVYRDKKGNNYALLRTDFVDSLLDARERIEEASVEVLGFLKPDISKYGKYTKMPENVKIDYDFGNQEYFFYEDGFKYLLAQVKLKPR